MTQETPQGRMLLFGLSLYRPGWDDNSESWDVDYKWCLYIGFILLFYCTIALCCIMAGRCSKGGRDREVHTNEEVSTVDRRKRRAVRSQQSYDVI